MGTVVRLVQDVCAATELKEANHRHVLAMFICGNLRNRRWAAHQCDLMKGLAVQFRSALGRQAQTKDCSGMLGRHCSQHGQSKARQIEAVRRRTIQLHTFQRASAAVLAKQSLHG